MTKTRRASKQQRPRRTPRARLPTLTKEDTALLAKFPTSTNTLKYPEPQEYVASDEELRRRRKKPRVGIPTPPKAVFAIGTTLKLRTLNRKKLSAKEKQRLKQSARQAHASIHQGSRRSASSSASVRKLLTLRLGDSNLDGDLKAVAQFVTPTPRERAFRTRVFDEIQTLIAAEFPTAIVALYGSSSSGMETFRSDLDITVGNLDVSRATSRQDSMAAAEEESEEEEGEEISNAAGYVVSDTDDDEEGVNGDGSDSEPTFSLNLSLPGSSTTTSSTTNSLPLRAASARHHSPWNATLRRQKMRQLRALQSLLLTHRPHWKVQCLSKAKIPILMIADSQSGLHIDLGVNREVFHASDHGRTTTLVTQLQRALGEAFFQVVVFLKEFLHQFELDKPFTGGLGSYRLYMMVAYIFTTRFATGTGGTNKQTSPAKVLLTFLQLFGNRKTRGFWTMATELPVRHGALLDIVDFHAVFRLDDCADKFAMAFEILSKHQSLASVLYEETLQAERRACAKQILQHIEKEEIEEKEEEEEDSSDDDECFL